MLRRQRTESPMEYYWPTEPDPARLTSYLFDRIEEYADRLEENRLLHAITKNWRFYHGLFFGSDSSTFSAGVKYMGQDGEYVGLPDNHYRTVIQGILNIITEQLPAFKVIAVNADQTSLEQARLGNDILNYYMKEKRVREKLRRAVEHSLIFLRGFVKVCWDKQAGEPIAGMDGQFIYEGDLKITTPTVLDMAYDLSAQDFDHVRKHSWLCLRSFENRWDLAATYPEHAEELVQKARSVEGAWRDRIFDFVYRLNQFNVSDTIETWEFYHARTPALPMGAYVKFCDNLVLERSELQYPEIPIYSVAPSEMLLTSFGYSPALDLVGLQQALTQDMSAILSNHKQFGMPCIWTKTDSGFNHETVKEAFNHIECDEEPKVLGFLNTPAEMFKFPEVIRQSMQTRTGVNSVRLGQPEKSLESGSALALIDAKAVEANSVLQVSYQTLIEDVGTCMLKTLRRYANTERVISIVGQRNRQFQRNFIGEDLGAVDRVQVQATSYLTQTSSGRLELANNLLQNNQLKTPEEYLTVALTGNLEPLYMAEHAQLSLIHDENERLLLGENVQADITDNHVLHVKEHMAQIASVDARNDIAMASNIRAHCATHLQMIADPEALQWAVALGYQDMLQVATMFMPQPGAQPGATTPGGSKPGDTNVPGEAGSEARLGDTTPKELNEPTGSATMPNMPSVPTATATR